MSRSESSGLMRTTMRRSRSSAEPSADSLRSRTRGWDASARIATRLSHAEGVISSASAAALMPFLVCAVTVACKKCRVANVVSSATGEHCVLDPSIEHLRRQLEDR